MILTRLQKAFFLGWLCILMATGSPRADGTNEGNHDIPAAVEAGLSQLLALDSQQIPLQSAELQTISPVLDFIRKAPAMAEHTPAERQGSEGSFISFDIQRPLQDVIRYAYNANIPLSAVNPSSINHGSWITVEGHGTELPKVWEWLDRLNGPRIVRGVVRESITPDLHSGAYYEYNLHRTILFYRQGSLHVVVSLSNQIGPSAVGRKGFIVGPDDDWNYLYTQEQGLNRMGLGWVKSKIYKFISAACYIEDQEKPGQVRIGVFQWLDAGWAGLNVVHDYHIRRGLERYASQVKLLMESPRMPAPQTLENIYLALQDTDETILRARVADITQQVLQKAEEDDSIHNKALLKKIEDQTYVQRMSKNELISNLMKEFVKMNLGKDTLLKRSFWLALRPGDRLKENPPAL